MIALYIVILIVLSIVLGIIIQILHTYYKENKIWNNGKCPSCLIKYKKAYKPYSKLKIYTCGCNTICLLVKNVDKKGD